MKAPIGESYRLLPLQLRDPGQGGATSLPCGVMGVGYVPFATRFVPLGLKQCVSAVTVRIERRALIPACLLYRRMCR
ncbi:hypothetical protein, partial [Cutibacterium acnes]|uniref:hypothetical protein n=1 Tax=Cutibacterium acnes TaxID=1747 RepID=UPI0025501A8C